MTAYIVSSGMIGSGLTLGAAMAAFTAAAPGASHAPLLVAAR